MALGVPNGGVRNRDRPGEEQDYGNPIGSPRRLYCVETKLGKKSSPGICTVTKPRHYTWRLLTQHHVYKSHLPTISQRVESCSHLNSVSAIIWP